MKTVPLTKFKADLSELLDEVIATHEIVTVTRNGYPSGVFMSSDEFESWKETLFWTSQPGFAEDVAEARAEIAEGRTMPLEQFEAELRRNR